VTGKGIFRGSGNFIISFLNIVNNFRHLLGDLFIQGNSYYFEIPNPDFSNYIPILSMITLIYLAYKYFRYGNNRNCLYLIFLVFALTLFIGSFTSDPSNLPGIRRSTGIIVCLYTLFIFIWNYVLTYKPLKIWQKNIFILLLLIIPIHHILVYGNNLNSLEKPSQFKTGLWFSLAKNPQDSINLLLPNLQKQDLKLSCFNEKKEAVFCRYPEIYASLAGACLWNHLNCHNILGYDEKTKQYIPLNINLWLDYYWSH
jgi:hypothetical protein